MLAESGSLRYAIRSKRSGKFLNESAQWADLDNAWIYPSVEAALGDLDVGASSDEEIVGLQMSVIPITLPVDRGTTRE